MRLSPDLVHSAEQSLNCLGDRELVLRNMAIPVIENLAVARDSFDTIDLSANLISSLGDGFPPFPRLRTLHLGSNRISNITRGIADSLPNLHVLILTSNRISSIEDLNLSELSRFKQLQVLSISDNPVANIPDIRRKLLRSLPSLKIINFAKVSYKERKSLLAGTGNYSKRRKRNNNLDDTRTTKRHQLHDSLNFNKSKISPTAPKRTLSLNASQAAAVRARIENAQSVEEVLKLQEAIRSGAIRDILENHTQE